MLFRIALIALALTLGCYGLLSEAVEWNAAARPTFPSGPENIAAPSGDVPAWSGRIPLFRSDLQSNDALIIALQAIQGGRLGTGASNDQARSRVRQALSAAPYDAELWLALALLETQRAPNSQAAIEALKLAYFTAPNDARLMPVRLDTATASDALVDPELAELARGDVRLMLMRRPELKTAIVLSYRRASKQGKAFLEQAVQTIDPSFVAALRS